MGDAPSPSWADFVAGWELFRDPIACGVAAGLVLGALGVFIVLRRMVFVTAVVGQSAALGVALSFFAAIHAGVELDPVLGAVVLAIATTLFFAMRPGGRALSRESVLGAAYVTTASLAVIVGEKITQEAHDVAAILFGTAVLVRPLDLWLVLGVGGLVLVTLIAGLRGFVFASYDPEGARVHGVPVRALDATLFILIALEVSVATRALGALPVFAFAVLPAMSALQLGRRIESVLALAALAGALAGGLGYVLAFFASLPVGASQTVVAVAIFFVTSAVRRRE